MRTARAGGFVEITEPGRETYKCDTVTCAHCNTIVFVKPKEDASDVGGFCRLCFKHICGPCADLGKCTPFERKLEEMERSAALMRQLGDATAR